MNITLTPHQQQVLDSIKDFMNSDASVFILRGYAGTGKTTAISDSCLAETKSRADGSYGQSSARSGQKDWI